MSEPKLISPMLDGFMIGDPISDHHGVRSCPAMDQVTQDKYIVKIISTPSTPQKLDALLLSGAYPSKEAALSYFEDLTKGIENEISVLEKLSSLEGFTPYEKYQIVPMEDGNGFDVYLLGAYKRTLARQMQKEPLTHLAALNLGLDLCAALSVCRRSGYLYVDLKPENVYCINSNFRIGDIGFVKLDSLKYASLPERYLSAYTAPEITDAYSDLNTTVDIYAAGMILYQVFNGGVLPDTSTALVAPDYADYEMAEIILKACAADPADRWQDPVEMGQALVSYMQRNGANDTPILPPASVVASIEDAEDKIEDVADPSTTGTDVTSSTEAICATAADEIIESVDLALSGEIVEESEAPASTETAEEILASEYAEDSFGNLSFLDENSDETLPGAVPEDEYYGQISVEISDILDQVNELVSHPTPAPVIAPEAIEVQIPEVEEEAEPAAEAEPELEAKIEQVDNEPVQEDESEVEEDDSAEENDETDAEDEDQSEPYEFDDEAEETIPARKKSHWLRYVILAVLLIGLLIGGYYFYKDYYVLHIDAITLNGNETELTVLVDSKIDESLLVVVCSDTYGNQRKEAVVDGKAIFKDLAPDSAYTVKVQVSKGFHKLTGKTSSAYTTPVQTNIAHFSAVTGQTDGSVVLRFTSEGPLPAQWNISYVADGEEKKDITFSGNILEISDLTIGKEYTFTLAPAEDLFYAGNTEIKHTASKLVYAEDLMINDRSNGKLSISWSAPAGSNIENWTVHCYNDKGFDETVVTNKTSAVFENIEDNTSYNVEVAAAGMSVTQRTLIAADAVSVKDFKLIFVDGKATSLNWNYTGDKKQNWRVSCTADGVAIQDLTVKEEHSVEIAPMIPGAKYRFNLQTADGTTAVGGVLIYTAPKATDFDAYNIKKSDIELRMCHTPSKKNWDRYDVPSSDFTTKFSKNDKASFLLHLDKKPKSSKDSVTTFIVIRDASGQLVSSTYSTATWKSMWDNRYSEFNIPTLPQTAGEYTLSVYFNNGLAASKNFTIK